MNPRFLASCLVPLAALACASSGPPPSALQPSAAAPVVGSPAPPAPVASETLAKLRAAVDDPQRPEKQRARDVYRHPYETLAFFGLRDDANVVELWAGGGYYTSILAPLLRERGQLTVTHFDPTGDPKSEDTEEAREILAVLDRKPEIFGRVARQPIRADSFSFGKDASADFVLTFRNVHNWIESGYAAGVFTAAARVLKSGGILGVEEHRGKPGMTEQQIKDTGYVPEDVVIGLAEHAGLALVARSEINANPKDTKDYPKGVWSLPPTFAEKDVNRDRYATIGESDRMTLAFRKP
jgi:predicted methyltransferase